jgi:hypothetical protein
MILLDSGMTTAANIEVFDTYPGAYGDQEIVVIGPGDFRAPAALAIEKFNMMLLGDPEPLVDIDLAKGLEVARFLAIFSKGQSQFAEAMLGVVRVSDTDQDGKIRTLKEVSEVTGEPYDVIFGHFVEQTGQENPHKVYDINTYGMSEGVWIAENKELFDTTKWNLMHAMTGEGNRRHVENGATHATAYFNADSWGYFKHKGYEWEQLNGYNPARDVYVDPQTGIESAGQALVPTVLDIAKHLQRVRSGVTAHLRDVDTAMFGANNTIDR